MKLLVIVSVGLAALSIAGSAPDPSYEGLNLEQSTSTLALNVALLKLLDQNDLRGARYLVEHNVNHNIFYLTKFRRAELTEPQLKVLTQAIEYRRNHPFRRSDYGHKSISEDEEVNNIVK